MAVLKAISIAVFVLMLAGVCAAALTACSDDGNVVLEGHTASSLLTADASAE